VRKPAANRYTIGYGSVSFLRQKQENGTLPSINNRVTNTAAPCTHWLSAHADKLKIKEQEKVK